MKKSLLKRMCYSMGLLAIISCTDEEVIEQNVIDFKANVETPIVASTPAFESASSRTFIDENAAYESGVGTLWRANEVIGVYGSSSKNVKFTSTNKSSAGSVAFSGLMLGTPKYAYYPYSDANKGVSVTSVKQTMPTAQEYSTVYKDLVADFRSGVFESRSWFTSTFTFTRLVSLLRFEVNATGTALEGSYIKSVSIKVGNKRQIAGDFTVNLQNQTVTMGNYAEGNDSLALLWSNEPQLSKDRTCVGYLTAMPNLKSGDDITFIVKTDTHVATFTRTSKVDFVANYLYTYPLVLANFPDMKVTELPQYVEPEEPETVPVEDLKISSFKFEIAKNTGKILPGKVVGNSSTYKATYNASYYGDAVACDIDDENKKISLYLPYLNNRKLVPTFEIPEGTVMISEAGEMISGETEVDFTQYKQVAVVNTIGEAVVYNVELTNSGLPVVVINQETGVSTTENNNDYEKASEAWYTATQTKWVAKDDDWTVDEGKGGDISRDNFMVYNADGTPAITDKNGATLSEPLFSGTRIRGNVTQQMPKKAFAVKLDKKSGVLDMKPHKRWVLLANWKDRTLMRNAVAFGIAKKFKETFPNDGIAWNPSGQFVELVYNGVHVGNYYLCEQIKIDGNRLDINDPYDKDDAYSGNPADYGYLLECDDAYDETWKFLTKKYIPFLFKDDGNDDMLNYASTFVRGLEEKITAGNYAEAYENMDLTSMVDFLLIQELMMNSEMKHPKSCYTYINNGKFYAGPIWDFDWNTLPVSSSYSEEGYSSNQSILAKANVKSSSSYPSSPNTTDANYMWYTFLTQDDEFTALAAERWDKVSGAIQGFVDGEIPLIQAKIAKSEAENNAMWPVDAKGDASSKRRGTLYGIGGWLTSAAGYCGDEDMTFEKAVQTLQTTLSNRISGMSYVSNQNWPSSSSGSSWWSR